MSWRASAFVKGLTEHADGSPITAREKLILFVLADSHNEDYGYAWPSIDRAARQSLTSRRRFIALMKRLEEKGTLLVERREGRSNLYRFAGGAILAPLSENGVQELHGRGATASALRGATASAPKPLESLHVTDIQPASRPLSPSMIEEAIRRSREEHRPADTILAELRRPA